jgi:hypothetical protein
VSEDGQPHPASRQPTRVVRAKTELNKKKCHDAIYVSIFYYWASTTVSSSSSLPHRGTDETRVPQFTSCERKGEWRHLRQNYCFSVPARSRSRNSVSSCVASLISNQSSLANPLSSLDCCEALSTFPACPTQYSSNSSDDFSQHRP